MAAAHEEPAAVASEPRLFVGQVPSTYKEAELRPFFEPHGTIKEIHVVCSPDGRSRGCAMVTFERWSAAEAAIDAHNGKTVLSGGTNRPLTVSFAHPKRATSGAVQQELGIAPKKLFVGQVPVSAGEAELRTLFAPCGTVSSINMLKRPGEASHKGCGFVEFATWAACEKAIDAHNGVTTMAGSRMPLVVKFADARRPPPTGPVPITGLKRGSVGDAHWQGGGKRPSLQPPGVRAPIRPPNVLPSNGMEPYHPHAMAAMNLGLNIMAMGGPALAQQLANGPGVDPQHAASLSMLAAGTGAAPPMPAGAAGPYAPPFGHVPGMAPQGPPGGPGPHTVHAGNNAHVAHAAHAAHNPAGMHAGAQAPTQANPYASAQANPYGMPPAMPYGAMGGIHAHPYGNGAQYGAVSVPQPTPVVTTNGRLGKGLSPDNRELRWKLFIGQVPHEATPYDLWNLFSGLGEICELHVLTKPDGRSNGCAFLTYAYQASAERAIQLMDMHPLGNKQLRVKFADHKSK